MNECQQEFVRLIKENSRRYRLHEVFRDFCEMAALAISNSVDLAQFEAREAQYMQIIKRYEPEEARRFSKMLAMVTEGLSTSPHDFLGAVFMALELSDSWKGQFFTASELCKLMARLNCGSLDAWRKAQDEGRFFTMHEPAVGAGAMVIAYADLLQEEGINFQQVMHVQAWDVDATAAHMAYIQFSLLYIPAIVVQGNTLTLKQWGAWYTPAHVLGGWSRRLAAERNAEKVEKPFEHKLASEKKETTPRYTAETKQSFILPKDQLALF